MTIVKEEIKMSSTEKYVLVTDGIIEMNCVSDSYKEAANLFLEYLKNQNDDSIYELHPSGEIYEYRRNNLKTVHFIFNKHYIDVLRHRKGKEALDMAIKALEQQPCDDTISRPAAIDVYGDWYVEEGTEEGFIGTVKQLLETLPSAQPEQL